MSDWSQWSVQACMHDWTLMRSRLMTFQWIGDVWTEWLLLSVHYFQRKCIVSSFVCINTWYVGNPNTTNIRMHVFLVNWSGFLYPSQLESLQAVEEAGKWVASFHTSGGRLGKYIPQWPHWKRVGSAYVWNTTMGFSINKAYTPKEDWSCHMTT